MNEPIVNKPPALAVALEYTGEGAPRVTAKGGGLVAENILRIAKEHKIPLHEDRELAGLLSKVELGDEIPSTLYLAIAEVIAFAYGISHKEPPLPARRLPENRSRSEGKQI